MSRTFHASGKRPCGARDAQRKFCIELRNRTAQNEDGIEMRGDESSQERACGLSAVSYRDRCAPLSPATTGFHR
jgi:hypothetical protein